MEELKTGKEKQKGVCVCVWIHVCECLLSPTDRRGGLCMELWTVTQPWLSSKLQPASTSPGQLLY